MQYHSDGAEVAAEKHLNEFNYDQDMEDDQQNYKDGKEFEQGGDTDKPSNHSDETMISHLKVATTKISTIPRSSVV